MIVDRWIGRGGAPAGLRSCLRVGALTGWLVVAGAGHAATPLPDPQVQAWWSLLGDPLSAHVVEADGQPRSEPLQRVGIIGQDRRRRLSAQEEQDYSGVVAIYSEKTSYEGSGFLVCDGSVVLTSAHNFYDDDGKLRADFSDYKAFLSNKAGDFQEMQFDTHPGARVVGGTANLREFRNKDWILIRLRNRPNPSSFKPLKVRAPPEVLKVRDQQNSGIKVVGFLNGANWNRYLSHCMNFRSASSVWNFSSTSAELYAHDCSTEGGASGSPIIQGNCQGSPQAIAVHAAGPIEFKSSFSNQVPGIGNNTAAPINQAILDGMRKLCGPSFRDAVCPAPSGVQIASAPATGIDRERVREIQELLSRHGYSPGPADGLMGARTRGAIEQFQRDTGRAVIGEATAKVLEALRQHRASGTAVAAAPARPATNTPSPTAARIREFQTLLAQLGYDPGPADAVMRRSLQDAIKAFEQSHGLPPTGVPSDVLLALLRVSAGTGVAGTATTP